MDKAAIYCRLSKEDFDKLNEGDESESIINQRLLLTEYAINHGFYVTQAYIDDDYSGLYNDRPAFTQLIQDAKLQKFNIVLAKTQSRFTRNMEHVEKYLHNDFPLLGIRFIGVIDGVDTSVKSNKKARQINGLINEWYSEDLSENVKAVFREKMKKGQFIGSFACYGYKKDPNDNHKLIIDAEAAEVIRFIFDLCLDGYGIQSIANKLTEMKLPTPTVYKQLSGYKFFNPNDNSYSKQYGIWSTTTIKRILNNETYIGTLIQGREKKVSYKSKKVIIAPKEEWVIIENNHEPIILKEIFDKAQILLHQRRKVCNTNEQNKPHIFSGKIKCADCGSTMVKTSGKSGGGYDYFICQLSRKSKGAQCTRHSIQLIELKNLIEERIRGLLKEFTTNYYNDIIQYINVKEIPNTDQIIKAKISRCRNEIENTNNSFTSLYLDKVNGALTENEFIYLKAQIHEKLNNLTFTEESLLKELDLTYLNKKIPVDMKQIINQTINFKELSFDLINTFISCIYIGEQENGKQTIKILWNI